MADQLPRNRGQKATRRPKYSEADVQRMVRHYSHPARFSIREIGKAEGINYKTLWAMLHGTYVTQEAWDLDQGRLRQERADLLVERVAAEKEADLKALRARNNEARRRSGSLKVRYEQQSNFEISEDR